MIKKRQPCMSKVSIADVPVSTWRKDEKPCNPLFLLLVIKGQVQNSRFNLNENIKPSA